MGRLLLGFLGSAALAWASCAAAHSNEMLASMRGAHGGQLQAVGLYHVELVVTRGNADVWVTDHADNAQPTDGASGSVMVVNPSGTVTIPLAPAGGNKLAARDARIKPGPDTRVAVILTMKGQESGQARFVLNQPAPLPPHAGHAH